MLEKEPPIKGIIKSLGLVFGDIGTSPIYTLTVIFLLTKPTEANVIGVLSLIVWTLIILVTMEYAWLAMSLGKKGEGGIIVLKELLVPLLKSGRKAAFVSLLSFIGISLFIGDGVITPAISILSAIIYEDNIFVSIIKRDDPFGVTGFFKEDIAKGLRLFEIQYGYMEVVDVEEILREAGIEEKTIFYGIEDITTRSAVWKMFSIIKKVTPAFVQFYKLPSRKLHGVITRVEM